MLTRPIGQGGMGTVWHARHPDGVDVAVKVLRQEYAADSELMEAFRREVRAVGLLDHPGIVRVFDYGAVPAAAASASGDQLSAGSPWLAMEFASGGTLADHKAAQSWGELVQIAGQILAGLAHSHAHDIVHRDLKPRNVLLHPAEGPDGADERGALRISVTDFGIAHALTRQSNDHAQAGTPGYMAPEQILGNWRDLGPWTDLYAVGCLAWRLATGRSAFGGDSKATVLRAQIEGRPNAFEPVTPLPDGAEQWIRTLMQADPRERFRCAADAAHAMHELSMPRALRPRGRTLPPQPADWRPGHPPTTVRPAGTGLALFLLRPWPLVGREAVQDQLWAHLGAVRASRRAACVVLSAASGLGRSRLARWLGERALEVGAAWVLRAHHDADGTETLASALRVHLGVADLAPEEAWKRLTGWVAARGRLSPSDEAADLTALLFPEPLGGGPHPASKLPRPRGAPRDEHGAWFGLFDLLCREPTYDAGAHADGPSERPLVLIVDDLHHSDLAPLLAALVGTDRPVLIVATLEPSQVLPMAMGAIERLVARSDVITLRPLSPDEQRQLVDGGIGLGARVAERIVERTGGNPSFAVDIVRDWARRGLLVPTSTGFGLREGADVRLPEALAEQLQDRLAGLGDDERLAVEILATLGGRQVREEEWAASCRCAAVPFDEEIAAGLVRSGVVTCRSHRGRVRWSLEPLLLRETCLDAAADGGRLRGHHDACATALLESGRVAARERAVVHLIDAGHATAALKTLRVLIDGVRDQPERFASLVATEARLLDALKVPAGDARRLPAAVDRLVDEVRRTPLPALREALVRFPTGGDPETIAKYNARAHRIVIQRLEEAWRLRPDDPIFDDADRWQREADDAFGAAVVERIRGQAHLRSGALDKAEASLTAARAELESAGDLSEKGRLLRALGEVIALRRPADDFDRVLAQARVAFAAAHDEGGAASLEVVRARLARVRGDLVTALDRARRAVGELAGANLDPSAALVQLGFVRLARGEPSQARARFEEVLRLEDPTWSTIARGGLLVVTASSATDWTEWDALLAAWRNHGREGPLVHPDSGWPLEWAGKRAVDAGSLERGSEAYELAANQYALLGDREGLDRMRKKLRAIAHTAPGR